MRVITLSIFPTFSYIHKNNRNYLRSAITISSVTSHRATSLRCPCYDTVRVHSIAYLHFYKPLNKNVIHTNAEVLHMCHYYKVTQFSFLHTMGTEISIPEISYNKRGISSVRLSSQSMTEPQACPRNIFSSFLS
jgi:hypothetical protein